MLRQTPLHMSSSVYQHAVRLLTDDGVLQALGQVGLCAACFGFK